MVLKLDGHDVQVSHDGGQALEAVRRFRPEVVLMDIGLPGMDGYEVARRLREDAGPGTGHRTAGRRHRLRRGRGPAPFARGRLRPPSGQTGRPRRRAGSLGLAGMGRTTPAERPPSLPQARATKPHKLPASPGGIAGLAQPPLAGVIHRTDRQRSSRSMRPASLRCADRPPTPRAAASGESTTSGCSSSDVRRLRMDRREG